MSDINVEARDVSRSAHSARDEYPLFIAGASQPTSEMFEAINPSVGRPWAAVAQARTEDVDRAVAAARTALPGWRRTGPSQRQALLDRIADRIEGGPDWPVLLATENGRPIREAELADMPTAVAIFRYYAGLARSLHGDYVTTDDPELRVFTVREPLGVVAALIPWNSPLISTALKVAPALSAGNTVVMKPSEFAAPSMVEFGLRTADLLPAGVVDVITGYGPQAGADLVGHPGVDKISFTGGVPTARSIMRSAAENVTPSLLELGGKSAFVICPDADLDLAVADALKGILFQNGEVCFAASRLFLHDAIRDKFLDRFAATLARVHIGDATNYATQMGPLVSAPHRDRVLGYIERAEEGGATVIAGGGAHVPAPELAGGFYVDPTVIDDPAGDSVASHEEIFGPVVAVQHWQEEADVIARANASELGLAAGVWTRDISRAHRFASALEAGTVWVNTWFDVAPGQPLGGIKASGFGREMTAETLLEYTAPKAVAMRLSADRPELFG